MDIELIEQIERWKESIQQYKETYGRMFNGKQPGEKCIMSHCKLNNIPYPLPKIEIDHFVPSPAEYSFGGESEG